MVQILRILYILFIGYLVYVMIKRGDCCGHHRHSHDSHSRHDAGCCSNKSNYKKTIDLDKK